MSRVVVELDKVCIVFGNAPERALPLMDDGESREKIQSDIGQILGVHDCSLSVEESEIVVLMGLFRLRQIHVIARRAFLSSAITAR